jgi:hypothetical protein
MRVFPNFEQNIIKKRAKKDLNFRYFFIEKKGFFRVDYLVIFHLFIQCIETLLLEYVLLVNHEVLDFRIVNIPQLVITILLPLGRILDRLPTVVNIFGNMRGVIYISQWFFKKEESRDLA